jgi:hypothetical protein
MLSYPNEGHVILDEHSREDYSLKVGQFLDYYLKNTPEPIWMNQPLKITSVN